MQMYKKRLYKSDYDNLQTVYDSCKIVFYILDVDYYKLS
jgi:hypothetical protein